MSTLVPVVVERTASGERSFDIYSRLLDERIVFLGTQVDETSAGLVVAQLLHLESADPERDVHLYISSPGGLTTGLFAIYDTMQYIRPDVATTCLGMAASAAAVLLAAGAPGKRSILPHATVLLHQPSGGMQGQSADVEIHAREIVRTRRILDGLLARHTGQDVERISRDTDRDFILDAPQAVEYGLVDQIVDRRDLPPGRTPAGLLAGRATGEGGTGDAPREPSGGGSASRG